MNFMKPVLAGAVLAMATSAAQAAVMNANSYGEDATGNWAFFASDTVVLTNLVTSSVAGILDSYTIWVQEGSTAATAGFDLDVTLLGGHSGPLPEVSDVLASSSFSGSEIYSGDSFTGGNGNTFFALAWDLSNLGISTEVNEQFAVRFSNGSSGLSYGINGNALGQPNALPHPGTNFLTGSPSSLGTSNPQIALSFLLEVDEVVIDPDPIAPVPLPAGLPLLLAGLGVFGLIRRRG